MTMLELRHGLQAALRDPSVSVRKYSIVPPTSSGILPRSQISRISVQVHPRESAPRDDVSSGLDDVDQMMRRLSERGGVRFRSANVHVPVDLRRIHANQLTRQGTNEIARDF